MGYTCPHVHVHVLLARFPSSSARSGFPSSSARSGFFIGQGKASATAGLRDDIGRDRPRLARQMTCPRQAFDDVSDRYVSYAR